MNDTPETDLHEYEFQNRDSCAGETLHRIHDGKDVTSAYTEGAVPSSFARKLEQRLNAALEIIISKQL